MNALFILTKLGATDTKEGLDTCFSLSYYSRVRLVVNLLPLLRRSSRPRVLSVLNGGKETAINEDDPGLDNPQHYAPQAVSNHTTLLMTLALELLARKDTNIMFMHVYPGIVNTDNFSRLQAPAAYGVLGRVVLSLVKSFIITVQRLFGMSIADCGARQAFLMTTERYGPGDVWRVDQKCEAVAASAALEEYRERRWDERVWDFTQRVFERALATGS
jgi:NAD(P)-dependent dehydrogenase (short-subunit alcohol dehydrogenase family)